MIAVKTKPLNEMFRVPLEHYKKSMDCFIYTFSLAEITVILIQMFPYCWDNCIHPIYGAQNIVHACRSVTELQQHM